MIRIELEGCFTARYKSVVIDHSKRERGSPICDLARLLIKNGRSPDEECVVYRGDTLCFLPVSLSTWADKYVAEPDTAFHSARFRKWKPRGSGDLGKIAKSASLDTKVLQKKRAL